MVFAARVFNLVCRIGIVVVCSFLAAMACTDPGGCIFVSAVTVIRECFSVYFLTPWFLHATDCRQRQHSYPWQETGSILYVFRANISFHIYLWFDNIKVSG